MKSFRDALSQEAKGLARVVGDANDADVILFNGRVLRSTQQRLLRLLKCRKRRQNAFLILLSEGGDPGAAYKISRSLQSLYQRFICSLPAYSKSAATVILTGAHELVIGDDGEMGPLDVQMSKKDTVGDYESGLTVLNALTALHEKAYLAWEYFFMQTEESSGGSITVKTASHAASELTTGLFAPVYAQIDPLQIGEASRAMAIGNEYGKRLNRESKNLRPQALEKLVSDYPDHGFVIDRTEAKSLFYHVRQPTSTETDLFEQIEDFCDVETGRKIGIIDFLNDELVAVQGEEIKGDNDATTGTHPTAPIQGTDLSIPASGTDAPTQRKQIGSVGGLRGQKGSGAA